MRIAVSNPDNIGDLVLRQPMISALLDAGHEVALIVRDFVAPLASDVFPQAKVLQCTGNPYERDFGLQSPLGQAFLGQVIDFDPQIFVVASFQHTHLEELLAAALPKADCVGFSGHLYQSRPEITAVSGIRFATRVTVIPDSSELEKNAQLCAAVLGHEVRLGPPRMEANADGLGKARSRLDALGFTGQRFWAVCAGDIADKSVKNWRREQWAEFCGELLRKHDVPLLFIGSTDEHEATLDIQKMMGEASRRTASITAEPTLIRTLTGILQLAEGYIGKDTGPMHIAAALGKPVLAIFGGGHWPRFVPAAKTGAAFTVGVPCTGCNWTCHLERSHCVKDIPVSTVLRAAERLLGGDFPAFHVDVIRPDGILASAILRELWAAAQVEHRKVAAERANFMQWHEDRMGDIAGLRTQLEIVTSERDSTSKAAGEAEALRRDLLETRERLAQRQSEVSGLAAELAARDVRLGEVSTLADRAGTLEERAAALEFEVRLATANLRQATEDRIAAAAQAERFRHAALRKIAGTRLKLDQATAEVTALRAASEVAAASAGQQEQWKHKWESAAAETEGLRRELEAATVRMSALQLELDTADGRYLGRIADQEQLLRRRNNELASTLALIPDLRDELASLTSELLRSEEQRSSYAERFLATQNQLDQTLEDHAARLIVIESLSAEAAELNKDREAKQIVIDKLSEALAVSEADRQSRLDVITALSSQLTAGEKLAAEHRLQIDDLGSRLTASEETARQQNLSVKELSLRLEVSEFDRAARLDVIEATAHQLATIEADREARLHLIEDLSQRLSDSDRDREARLRLIEDLSHRLSESDHDREKRLQLIGELSGKLAESEKGSAERLRLIEQLSASLAASEADRANRGEQISVLHEHITSLQAELAALRNLLPYRILKQLHLM